MTLGRAASISGLAAVVLLSCGTDTGNGVVTMRVGLTGSGAAPVARDAQGTPFTIEAAQVFVRRIDLKPDSAVDCSLIDPAGPVSCSGGLVRIEGPAIVDLFTRSSTPALQLEVPAGIYRRVDIRLDFGRPNDGLPPPGHPLEDRTLVGSGTFDDGGGPTGFDFALEFNADARFESGDGFEVAPGASSEALLLLDATTWLSAVSITQCLAAGDLTLTGGRLQLADGRGACRALEAAIVDAVRKSGRLER